MIWYSPLNMVGVPLGSSESNLILTRGGFGNTLRVSSSQAGDLQWLSLPLIVDDNLAITGVTVCYELSNERSFISQIRLSEEKEPPSATVMHDDGTDLTSTTSECVESAVTNYQPGGAVTLSLRLNFGNGGDRIYIGAVGLMVGPS
jgi:hypothetical protein